MSRIKHRALVKNLRLIRIQLHETWFWLLQENSRWPPQFKMAATIQDGCHNSRWLLHLFQKDLFSISSIFSFILSLSLNRLRLSFRIKVAEILLSYEYPKWPSACGPNSRPCRLLEFSVNYGRQTEYGFIYIRQCKEPGYIS